MKLFGGPSAYYAGTHLAGKVTSFGGLFGAVTSWQGLLGIGLAVIGVVGVVSLIGAELTHIKL